MKRSLLVLAGAAVLGTVASSCSTFEPPAAKVNGVEISRKTFESELSDLAGAKAMRLSADGGTLSLANTAKVLNIHIGLLISRQELAKKQLAVTADDRAAAKTAVAANISGFADYPASVQALQIESTATDLALTRALTPVEADVAKEYADDPKSTGYLCLQAAGFATEAEATDAIAKLKAGGDYTTIAGQNTSPITSQTDNSPCVSVIEFQSKGLDPTFLTAFEQATVGNPSGPLANNGSYFLIDARPFADIKTALLAKIAGDREATVRQTATKAAAVYVDPRYGTWFADGGGVVAPTGPKPAPTTTPATEPATTVAAGG